jgi:predicted nuclease of predicted toxin-antitoxin system
LARWLRAGGHDAVHASDLGLSRAPDAELIAQAKNEARTMVTADLDYPRLLALAQSTEPSLILFRGGDWSDAEVIKRFGELLAIVPEVELAHSIVVVERDRLRRRRLPLGS